MDSSPGLHCAKITCLFLSFKFTKFWIRNNLIQSFIKYKYVTLLKALSLGPLFNFFLIFKVYLPSFHGNFMKLDILVHVLFLHSDYGNICYNSKAGIGRWNCWKVGQGIVLTLIITISYYFPKVSSYYHCYIPLFRLQIVALFIILIYNPLNL